ncbi:MAG: hypothetical protein H0X03_04845 [Nitrosopumilus sp.]|nr:hypothetical protein [Nitrosopumilus sp.]
MNFLSEPTTIVSGQNFRSKMSLIDENSGEKVQPVTYRISLNKDDQAKMSDFFHSYEGDLTISAKNTNSPNINVEGTFDILTNSIVSDPSGTIGIT